MHHTDLHEGLLVRNGVERIKASGLFDAVVLAVADVPENRALERFAASFEVEIVYGAEHDVARRLADCARAFDCETIARALVWWLFVDLELVELQLLLLESSDCDWVSLPRDFDLRFGVDAMRPSFFAKIAADLAAREPDGPLERSRGLNPWGLAEARPERFRIRVCEDVPLYARARFEELRREMGELWPSRWDGAATPLHPYRLARARLPRGGEVLDLACGLGAGTALLGERGRALGIDLDHAAIERSRARHGDRASFVAGDALALELGSARFDQVVSVHTMEHVADDEAFLERIACWLKPRGELVLEVPLAMGRPFLGIETPLSPEHLREYTIPGLLDLVGARFDVLEASGVARGAYVPLERARNAALVVARPKAPVQKERASA
jgi:SAM-dependent methyltransferase